MQKFMELWASGVGVTDVDSLIGDKVKFVERMARHPNSTMFNQELVQYVSLPIRLMKRNIHNLGKELRDV